MWNCANASRRSTQARSESPIRSGRERRGVDPVTDFLGDDESGGGVLDDIASHQLDLLPWLCAAPSAESEREAPATPQRAGTIVYELEFEDGVTAVCHVGHHATRKETLRVELRHRQLIVYADRLFELGRRSAAATRAYCRLRDFVDRALHRHPTEDGVAPFARQLRAFAAAARGPDGASGLPTRKAG